MKSYKKPYRYHTVISLVGLVTSLIAISAGLSLHSPQYTGVFIVSAIILLVSSLFSFFLLDKPQ